MVSSTSPAGDDRRPDGPRRLGGGARNAVLAAAAAALAAAGIAAAAGGDGCPEGAVSLGTWCLDAGLYPVPEAERGQANWFYAAQACASRGGRLPTAQELIGAAPRLSLAGRADENPANALIDADAGDGVRDRREMTGTLVTTRGGSDSSGDLGISEPATGDPRAGEPDPPPVPARTSPDTLQYVTVTDNRDRGGFAGSKPVGQPEEFRCAYGLEAAAGAAPSGGGGGDAAERPASAPALTAPKSVRVSALRRSGVQARVSCARDCGYRVELVVPQPDAFRLGLTRSLRNSTTLGRSGAAEERLDAGGRVTLRLRPSRALGARLERGLKAAGRSSVRARLRFTTSAAGASPTTTQRTITVRR